MQITITRSRRPVRRRLLSFARCSKTRARCSESPPFPVTCTWSAPSRRKWKSTAPWRCRWSAESRWRGCGRRPTWWPASAPGVCSSATGRNVESTASASWKRVGGRDSARRRTAAKSSLSRRRRRRRRVMRFGWTTRRRDGGRRRDRGACRWSKDTVAAQFWSPATRSVSCTPPRRLCFHPCLLFICLFACLSIRFNDHFLQDKPGLADYIGAKDDGSGCDNWSAIRRAKLQSNRHHQQTNSHHLTGPTGPVAQPKVSKHWREIYLLVC